VFGDDRRDERRSPDLSVEIPGLDEPRIAKWWRGITDCHRADTHWGNTVRSWTEFGWNSVRLVAAGLEEGSRGVPDSWMMITRLFGENQPVWTAAELRNYVARLLDLHGNLVIN
jgi:hypothetical protein